MHLRIPCKMLNSQHNLPVHDFIKISHDNLSALPDQPASVHMISTSSTKPFPKLSIQVYLVQWSLGPHCSTEKH